MEQYLIPADSSYHVYTQLAQCNHTGNMHASSTAFTRMALKVPDLSEAEKIPSWP